MDDDQLLQTLGHSSWCGCRDLISSLPRSPQLHEAIDRTTNWLLERQQPDGHWCGELEGDTILESEFILLLAWLGEEGSPVARKSAEYILGKQLPDGGWALYPGGGLEISASVKAYFALKLTGHDPASEPLQRARAAIRAAGGADAVNSFTRFYLALLGQIPYETCPAVPPEMVLLPDWSPINIYRISAWSRTIVVPLSIMWAFRPDRALAPELGIHELFLRQPEHWPALRCPGLTSGAGWFTWERFFRTVDRCLKAAERLRLRPLRQRALRSGRGLDAPAVRAQRRSGRDFPAHHLEPDRTEVLGIRRRERGSTGVSATARRADD